MEQGPASGALVHRKPGARWKAPRGPVARSSATRHPAHGAPCRALFSPRPPMRPGFGARPAAGPVRPRPGPALTCLIMREQKEREDRRGWRCSARVGRGCGCGAGAGMKNSKGQHDGDSQRGWRRSGARFNLPIKTKKLSHTAISRPRPARVDDSCSGRRPTSDGRDLAP